MDLSPVITMGAVMKDPETGLYDVSFIKGFPKGPRKLGISIHSPHFDRILEHYESRGQAAPFAHIIGHHPAFYLGALALAPYANDDYATIGSFLGEPLRLVPSPATSRSTSTSKARRSASASRRLPNPGCSTGSCSSIRRSTFSMSKTSSGR